MGSHIYDNAEKQKARDVIHTVLAAAASPQSRIMLLVGPKRHEVDTAVLHGWALENILCVEMSIPTMANFTREFDEAERLVIKPNQYRNIASKVCKNIAKGGGRIQAMHLDFCGPIESWQPSSPRFEIERVVRSGVLDDGALVAITVLNGRVKGYDSTDERRQMLLHAVSIRAKVPVVQVATGTYTNTNRKSKSPMLWSIFQIGGKQ